MIPKLVYVLNGVEKTHTFNLDEHSTFHQDWTAEEFAWTNPFTKERGWKQFGFYYEATIHYDAMEYLLLDLNIADFFNKNITSRKFYPNTDNPNEFYLVQLTDGISTDDASIAQAYTDVDVKFRGTICYPTPLNHPVGYWGDRRYSFRFSGEPDNDPYGIGDYTFEEISGGLES